MAVGSAVRLSVITPTYNRAGFLRDCLRTLEYSGVSDLEVVVVDDGSTDDTEQVAAASPLEPRYVRQNNAGPGAARNRGFQESSGEYVCFLDSDDEWLPGAGAKAVGFLDRYPEVDVLFADARMGHRDTGFVSWIEAAGQAAFQKLPGHEVEPGFRILDRVAFFRQMAFSNAVFPGAAILRRKVFEESGGFDPRIFVAEDWNLLLRLAASRTFAFWREPLAVYTKHAGGLTADKDRMCRGFCEVLDLLPTQVALTHDQRLWVAERLREHRFGYAHRAIERNDFREARRRFNDLLELSGFELRGFVYWLCCTLPFGLPGRLRRIKQWFAGTRGDSPKMAEV